MAPKEKISNEVVKNDNRNRTTYHYLDSETDKSFKSKEVLKKIDKFIIYPFYKDRKTGVFKQKYKKIHSFTFEGLNSKFPSGFITSPQRGYGVTRQLKPLIRFIESNFDIANITISKTKKTEIGTKAFIINLQDVDKIRHLVASVLRTSIEKNKTNINNYFATLFPKRFDSKQEKYQRGTFGRLFNEYTDVEKNLSPEDKKVLLKLFDKLSASRGEMFERKELITTKEKIERKFIEDVLKEFERLLKLKTIAENKWQDFFKENAWIFSQLFAYPTVLIQDKAYVGGKTIHDREGKIVDFLYANKLTKNSALIEIKKHTTKILSHKPYRGTDVFCIDKELSGAINQVLDQKDTYCKKFDSIRQEDDIISFNPKCIVVIGRIGSLTKKQQKTFELIRSGLKDVEIITFDELYERIKSILAIFKYDEN